MDHQQLLIEGRNPGLHSGWREVKQRILTEPIRTRPGVGGPAPEELDPEWDLGKFCLLLEVCRLHLKLSTDCLNFSLIGLFVSSSFYKDTAMSQGHCLGRNSRFLDSKAWGWGTWGCCCISLNLGSSVWLLKNDMTISEMSL